MEHSDRRIPSKVWAQIEAAMLNVGLNPNDPAEVIRFLEALKSSASRKTRHSK